MPSICRDYSTFGPFLSLIIGDFNSFRLAIYFVSKRPFRLAIITSVIYNFRYIDYNECYSSILASFVAQRLPTRLFAFPHPASL